MISVLIPTYNYKCYTLVHDLQLQLEGCGEAYEIIVLEDGGKDQVCAISNHRINELPHCQYIRNTQNVGRAAVRNALAERAEGEWLLFLDSDGMVCSNDFVQRYIDAANEGNQVICGGIVHPEQCPSNEQSLRWKYEKDYELRHGSVGDTFRSFCFLIRKEVFMEVRFDERYRKYGMEDIQFGLDLQKKGYHVTIIDNPLMNGDIETNERFLRKTEEAMQSLHEFSADLQNAVSILRVVKRLERYHVAWLVGLVLGCIMPMLKHNLVGKNPNLQYFAFYKLGYYLNIK